MATVPKDTADKIIANDGYFAGDPRVRQVIRYTNFEGGTSYAILYAEDVRADRYAPSPYVNNPVVIWRAE